MRHNVPVRSNGQKWGVDLEASHNNDNNKKLEQLEPFKGSIEVPRPEEVMIAYHIMA